MFLATQDRWDNFRREWMANAHPPLYYLLLRASARAGPWPLAYRAASILAGTGAVLVTALVARRLAGAAWTPAVAALAMALGAPAVLVSIEVRSYMVCVLFVLASFLFALDLLGPAPVPTHARLGFAATAALALLSDYCAVFYLGAVLALPVLLAALHPPYRRAMRAALPARAAADLGTVAPPLLVLGILYAVHARHWAAGRNPFAPAFYHPELETVGSFLRRTFAAEFNLFAPVAFTSLAAMLAVAAVVLAVAAWGARERDAAPEAALRAAPLAMAVLVAGGIVAAALLGRYPFGGALRHQFIVFPFAVLALALAADRALRRLGPRAARVAGALLASAVAAAGLLSLLRLDVQPDDPYSTPALHTFRRHFPDPPAVYVDQYSLVRFFMGHHQWRWRFSARPAQRPGLDHYQAAIEGRRMSVLIDRTRWNFDFRDPGTYAGLGQALSATGTRCAALFCVKQALTKTAQPRERPAAFADRVRAEAQAAGLLARRVETDALGVYAEVCLAGAGPL